MLHLTLVTLMLGQTPSITVTAPTANSKVVAGNTFNIEWDAVVVSDVKIELSTDGGSTWDPIVESVDSTKSGWKDYPWSVPDKTSTNCIIKITQYNASSPTDNSDTFTISAAEEEDEGGCAATPGSAVAVLLAFLWSRRKRGT